MPIATITPTAISTSLLTVEEFVHLPEPIDGSREELVRGVIESMPTPRFRHGEIQCNVSAALKAFVRPRRLGRVATETGVITEHDPDTVRGPDVVFWSAERLPLDAEVESYPENAPDLCVEVLSDSDRPRRLRQKLIEYFARDVRMVWVVDPEARTVTVYRGPDEGRLLWEDATLSGEDVLPGFECLVAELFA
ncbi:MAG: Uma2 family endonuclease [Planctomycetaceae bacterium]